MESEKNMKANGKYEIAWAIIKLEAELKGERINLVETLMGIIFEEISMTCWKKRKYYRWFGRQI